jgi:hypothetical protein
VSRQADPTLHHRTKNSLQLALSFTSFSLTAVLVGRL